MNVLWLCNVPLPRIAEDNGLPQAHLGGWLDGMASEIKKIDGLDLSVVFPVEKTQNMITGRIDGMSYFGVPQRTDFYTYDIRTEDQLKAIVSDTDPDIINIHGTERPHSLAMMNAALSTGHIDRTVVSTQGLVSVIQRHYMGHLPHNECLRFTLKDLIRHSSLIQQQKRFASLGQFEIETLKRAKHIIGRTTWNKACTSQINPDAEYHFCNENLREEFYQHEWKLDNCTRHSIFTSQAYYPLKGFHLLLEAFSIIVKDFPDARLFVAGYDNTSAKSSIKKRFWNDQYTKYIGELIDKYGLRDKITYTGPLNASAMRDRYLQSHVFVLPSSIENSSNSLGEAMLLGVPCVASYVGGVMDLLEHKKEGLLFQSDAPYMMANYICEIFKNDDLSQRLAANARNRALVTHNRKVNAAALYNIYTTLRYG